jgi:ribonucleoside-diphosphate reductase alpha subunit
MQVIKRDGSKVSVSFDKISKRIKEQSHGLAGIDIGLLTQKVIAGIYDQIPTRMIDTFTADTAVSLSTLDYDYDILASRILISNLHKETDYDYRFLIKRLYENEQGFSIISKELYDIVEENYAIIQKELHYERDYKFTYFGLKTLSKAYLLRIGDSIAERPQHMYMRVALGLHKRNLKNVFETYHLLSQHYYTHATPTLYNMGTNFSQGASCFLLTMNEDSIEGIYKTLGDCACISKHSGGIGLDVTDIRASGTKIKGSNGTSTGLVRMLKVFESTARYVDQGGGKRNGSFAIYLQPWHADIFEFLALRKNQGDPLLLAHDLRFACWVPDLLMKRVKQGSKWSLMCPHECPGLNDVYGEAFEKLYEKYESEKKFKKQVNAVDLWTEILKLKCETGYPYILYKDPSNLKNNQKNLGTLRSSNLCCEIFQYTSKDEIAVCNLASISLPAFFIKETNSFDYEKLSNVVKVIVRNLDTLIDVSYYPVKEAETSNKRHRPMGIGVQGLADLFFLKKYPFESEEAAILNQNIFEAIYLAACTASNELSKEKGCYSSFEGSPTSQGLLQFDLCNIVPRRQQEWALLKEEIKKYGLRNSLLVALMPTKSTSQILGNVESFEPITSNIYTRSTNAGTFVCVNKYLVNDLKDIGLWNKKIENRIIFDKGSIQNIFEIPANIRKLYKTIWEISQKKIIDLSVERSYYIDQSQSLNLSFAIATTDLLHSALFYAWEKGLKTGCYYLHSDPASKPVQFTVEAVEPIDIHSHKSLGNMSYCSIENKNDCDSCGS